MTLANDNTLTLYAPRVMFHVYARWAAVALNDTLHGYMAHVDGETKLHLKADAPKWLRDVRDAGPFKDHTACQDAIKNAAPGLI